MSEIEINNSNVENDEYVEKQAPEYDKVMLDRIKHATPEEMMGALDLAEARHSEIVREVVKIEESIKNLEELGIDFDFSYRPLEQFTYDALGVIGTRRLIEDWSKLESKDRPTFEQYVQDLIDKDEENHDKGGPIDYELWHVADYVLDGYFSLDMAEMFKSKDEGATPKKVNADYGYSSEHFKKIIAFFHDDIEE